jgi:hypothetical protein
MDKSEYDRRYLYINNILSNIEKIKNAVGVLSAVQNNRKLTEDQKNDIESYRASYKYMENIKRMKELEETQKQKEAESYRLHSARETELKQEIDAILYDFNQDTTDRLSYTQIMQDLDLLFKTENVPQRPIAEYIAAFNNLLVASNEKLDMFNAKYDPVLENFNKNKFELINILLKIINDLNANKVSDKILKYFKDKLMKIDNELLYGKIRILDNTLGNIYRFLNDVFYKHLSMKARSFLNTFIRGINEYKSSYDEYVKKKDNNRTSELNKTTREILNNLNDILSKNSLSPMSFNQ